MKKLLNQHGFLPLIPLMILGVLAVALVAVVAKDQESKDYRSKAASGTNGSITVRVYWDNNENGLQDEGETNIAPDGTVLRPTIRLFTYPNKFSEYLTMDATGTHRYSGLAVGGNPSEVGGTQPYGVDIGSDNNTVVATRHTDVFVPPYNPHAFAYFPIPANKPSVTITQGFIRRVVRSGAQDTCTMNFFVRDELSVVLRANPSRAQDIEVLLDGKVHHKMNTASDTDSPVVGVVPYRPLGTAADLYEHTVSCRVKVGSTVIYSSNPVPVRLAYYLPVVDGIFVSHYDIAVNGKNLKGDALSATKRTVSLSCENNVLTAKWGTIRTENQYDLQISQSPERISRYQLLQSPRYAIRAEGASRTLTKEEATYAFGNIAGKTFYAIVKPANELIAYETLASTTCGTAPQSSPVPTPISTPQPTPVFHSPVPTVIPVVTSQPQPSSCIGRGCLVPSTYNPTPTPKPGLICIRRFCFF